MNKFENQAYNEGLDAQTNGAGKECNPYPPDTNLHECWRIGWQEGADEDFEEDMNRE